VDGEKNKRKKERNRGRKRVREGKRERERERERGRGREIERERRFLSRSHPFQTHLILLHFGIIRHLNIVGSNTKSILNIV
jgi:hypothetical protein